MSLAHPCPSKIVCPPGDGFLGVDFPFANLSSELPDRDDFIDDFYGFYWLWPDLGSNWERNSCLGICRSLISQADADTCAAIQNLICLLDTWGVCPTCTGDGNGTSGPPIIARRNLPAQIFYNQMATCTAHCPDGLPFTYQVPAGMFAMPSQAMADRVAGSFACQLAQSLKLCLSTLVRQACVGQEYGADIRTNRAEPTTFTIVSGSLPPGITTSQPATNRFAFDGTPTTPGNYSFAVRAQVSDGRFMQKGYVINVMGATPDTLPNAAQNAFYSEQLSATGNVGGVTWSLESGVFPSGLSIDAFGLISGTPTEQGPFDVTIKFVDEDGNSCLKDYTLTVESPFTCPIFDVSVASAGIQGVSAAKDTTEALVLCWTSQQLRNAETMALIATIPGITISGWVAWAPTIQRFATPGTVVVDKKYHLITPLGAVTSVGDSTDLASTCWFASDDDAFYGCGFDFGTNHTFITRLNCNTLLVDLKVDLGIRPGSPSVVAYAPSPKCLAISNVEGASTLAKYTLPGCVLSGTINFLAAPYSAFRTGLVFHPTSGTFFASCVRSSDSHELVVEINPITFAVVRTYDLGEVNAGTVVHLDFDEQDGMLFAKGRTLLTVIDVNTNTVFCTVNFTANTSTVAFDAKSRKTFTIDFVADELKRYV